MNEYQEWADALPIRDVLEIIVGGSYDHQGNIWCPFHGGSKKPSAKIYDDENILYCYSEGEAYTPYKVLRNKHIKRREAKSLLGHLTHVELPEKKEIPDIDDCFQHYKRGAPLFPALLKAVERIDNELGFKDG